VIDDVVAAAVAAAPTLAAWSTAQRRDALHRCADALTAAADGIIATAADETGLTVPRLTGELDRTTGQLRLLGDYVAAGRHRPHRESTGPDGVLIRQIVVPIGPVAVFPASNFPLAFGVPGGDTASALAAGCPVVIKAHPAHPRTGQLLYQTLAPTFAAVPGAFALVTGAAEVSIALVQAKGIRAVGFTGSLAGGRALLDAAARREDPIPVYAEMGAINPVFVLPGAAAQLSRAATVAAAVVGSSGQLCTKPGVVVVPDTEAGHAFGDALAAAVVGATPHRMLTDAMAVAHRHWVETVGGQLPTATGGGDPAAAAITVTAEQLATAVEGQLLVEHFGPAVVIVHAPVERYADIAQELDGQLTATVQATDDPAELALARTLLPLLAARAGRIVFNGVPTGVAVVDAMLHGGPWPATSAPWSTSVGPAAIDRFQRPVALQGVPAGLL
jgi:NADP-dependent aldehyde dehydrogenase